MLYLRPWSLFEMFCLRFSWLYHDLQQNKPSNVVYTYNLLGVTTQQSMLPHMCTYAHMRRYLAYLVYSILLSAKFSNGIIASFDTVSSNSGVSPPSRQCLTTPASRKWLGGQWVCWTVGWWPMMTKPIYSPSEVYAGTANGYVVPPQKNTIHDRNCCRCYNRPLRAPAPLANHPTETRPLPPPR